MKKNNFLVKLNKEEKLELIEHSNEVSDSYLEKADNCLASAKLLFENNLYENSVSMSYYAMYDSLLALLFKIGVKSENHSASILLIKILFDKEELFEKISDAKKERIDKQYYVTTEELDITQDSSKELVLGAEDFIVNVKGIIKSMRNDEINRFRDDFKILVGIKDNKK